MNAQPGRLGQISEPVAGESPLQRQHGLCFAHLQIALMTSFLLALNPVRVNGIRSPNSNKGPQEKTVVAQESSADGRNRSQTRIQKVEFSRHERRIEVRVVGDGHLSYKAFPLRDPDRVVLDFSGALVQKEPKLVHSDLQPVRGARIGQFTANVARVVIDLKSKIPYTVREDANSVTVVFEPAAETGIDGASDANVAHVPNTVRARLSSASHARGDPQESFPQQLGNAQVIHKGRTEAHAKPSSSTRAEARLAEGQRGKPAAPTAVSERSSVVDKAEPESSATQVLPEGVLGTSSEKTSTEPSIAQDGAAAPQKAGSGCALAEADRDNPTQEANSSVPEPIAEAESKEKPNVFWTPPDQDYVIGIDDVLAINVWKEPDISRVVFVRPDGKISLPLIGEVKADGLTPQVLRTVVATELRSYLHEPEVTVAVQEMRSQMFNIVGEVNRPGAYQVSKPMTVLDAIAQAGGLRDFAKATKIYVLRLRPDGSRENLPFNYKKVIKGARERGSLEVKARDTIVVP